MIDIDRLEPSNVPIELLTLSKSKLNNNPFVAYLSFRENNVEKTADRYQSSSFFGVTDYQEYFINLKELLLIEN